MSLESAAAVVCRLELVGVGSGRWGLQTELAEEVFAAVRPLASPSFVIEDVGSFGLLGG